MRRVTLDASVLLKWYLSTPGEDDLPQARAILLGLLQDQFKLIQPAHSLIETAAVLARKRAQWLGIDLPDLQNVHAQSEIVETNAILLRGLSLAASLDHHLFDTLYHAVALEADATLVTADQRYYDKAAHLGNIIRLKDLPA